MLEFAPLFTDLHVSICKPFLLYMHNFSCLYMHTFLRDSG